MKYETGQQPCTNFNPRIEANAYGMWRNVHCCIYCDKTVSFCENCMRDHHEDGYETCERKERG